jgi:hypothetical protein
MLKYNMLLGTRSIVALWIGTFACGLRAGVDAGTFGSPMVTRTVASKSSRFFLGQADISVASVESIDEVVRRLRPDWLRAGPTQRHGGDAQYAAIYVGETFLGGLETLRLVQAAEVRSVEYLTPMAALGRFGPSCRCSGGAIVIARRFADRP